MRQGRFVGFGLALVTLAAATPVAGQNAPGVLSGAYTNAQADRGFTKFMQTCSRCHGADMQGLEAPALAGAAFMSRWQGKYVGDLFEHTLDFMPADDPKSLDAATVADLMAYVLQFNGYPAGDVDLPADPGALAGLRLESLPRRSGGGGAQVVDH